MYIQNIKLIGFRNYLDLNLDLDPSKTIILGKNAQGKSNLLEVIQILSHIKSRRASKDAELVNFDLKEAVIHAKAIKKENFQDEEELDIALLIRKSGRRTLKINDVSKKPQELLHNIYSVSFMVDDLEIVNGNPARRRTWLDSVISQLDKDYKNRLGNFEDVLKQRNSFLKDQTENGNYYYQDLSPSQQEQLAVWDLMYLEKANLLTESRENFIKELAPIAANFYKEISGLETSLEIAYQGQEINQADLDGNRSRDFARSYTNIGPQRDDITFSLEGNLASSFASQGERRTITLAIKLAELELLKDKHQDNPILLLDDVLAELDETRQDFLLDSVKSGTQVIITTTHIGEHLNRWTDNSQIIEISEGRVISNNKLAAPF